MPLNLLNDPWIPVRRRSGVHDVIRPAQIAEIGGGVAVVDLDWSRADFRIAGLEFLIGLLATAWPPRSFDEWLAGWDAPPEPAVLDEALAPIAHAFVLDGPGPRFLQDQEDLVSESEPVERLLIEAPGASTVRANTDLLVHRGRAAAFGRTAAAMALYTLQSWAPAGGAGNRTGLRGGGPLTTLVVPGDAPSLWQLVWANVPVETGPRPTAADWPRIFPWLAPTVTSEGTERVTPDNAHPLQCWWGMPRRIRLDFAERDGPAPCDLTGVPDRVQVVGWRQRPRGPNYAGWADRHPLTPRYRVKPGGEWLSVHPQADGIGYRHWLGLVVKDPEGLRLPAPSVANWRDRERDVRDAERGQARLLAAGFDMDNMKARGFVESEMPLPGAQDPDMQARMDDVARCLIKAAEQVAGLLRLAVRNALFGAGATVKADASLLSSARERLWAQTEAPFFAVLGAISVDGEVARTVAENAPCEWQQLLSNTALRLFDEMAPLEPDLGPVVRRVQARRGLLWALTGFGTAGRALFETLGLPPAESKAAKRRKSA